MKVILLAFLALLHANLPAAAGLDASCAPGGNIDLSKWQLQLPIGGDGSPETVASSELDGCSGYKQSQYFYTSSTDGSLVMKVPDSSSCVTTTHSEHCRTELREEDPPSWKPTDPYNRLTADLVVVKNSDKVVVGQIHIDGDISTKPVAELYYLSSGQIRLGVNQCKTCSQTVSDVGHVPLGTRFMYEIRYEKNVLSVSLNGGAFKTFSTYDLNAPLSYFKAGNYNQGQDATEVHFFSIQASHQAGGFTTLARTTTADITPAFSSQTGIPQTQESQTIQTATTPASLLTPTPSSKPGSGCGSPPAVPHHDKVSLALFEQPNCCNTVETTHTSKLNKCVSTTGPFRGFYEGVGQGMFKRDIHVYAYTEKGCTGDHSRFKLTNAGTCWNSGKTWNSFKLTDE